MELKPENSRIRPEKEEMEVLAYTAIIYVAEFPCTVCNYKKTIPIFYLAKPEIFVYFYSAAVFKP